MASTLTSEPMEPSITHLYPLRTRIPYSTKVVLYTGIDVTGLTAMRNTLETPLEHLGKIQRTLPHIWPPNTTGHQTTMDNFSFVGREGHGFTRTINESIYIRVSNPTLNKNIGKYSLSHIWAEALVNTLELQIKHQWGLPTCQKCREYHWCHLGQPHYI